MARPKNDTDSIQGIENNDNENILLETQNNKEIFAYKNMRLTPIKLRHQFKGKPIEVIAQPGEVFYSHSKALAKGIAGIQDVSKEEEEKAKKRKEIYGE